MKFCYLLICFHFPSKSINLYAHSNLRFAFHAQFYFFTCINHLFELKHQPYQGFINLSNIFFQALPLFQCYSFDVISFIFQQLFLILNSFVFHSLLQQTHFYSLECDLTSLHMTQENLIFRILGLPFLIYDLFVQILICQTLKINYFYFFQKLGYEKNEYYFYSSIMMTIAYFCLLKYFN